MKVKKSNIYKPFENSISDMLERKKNDKRPELFNLGKEIEVTEKEFKRLKNWAIKIKDK